MSFDTSSYKLWENFDLYKFNPGNPTDESSYEFIVVDALHLFYRNFNSLWELRNSAGFKTGGIYGFLRSLISYKNSFKGRILILWDGHPSFRYEVFPEYKAGRSKNVDESFSEQQEVLKKILNLVPGVIQVYSPSLEADDLAANFSRRLKGSSVMFVSGDADWYTLISDSRRHHLFRPGYNDSKSGVVCTESNFISTKSKKIVSSTPKRVFLEKVMLMSDASDNVKGIPRFNRKCFDVIVSKLYESEEDFDSLNNWRTLVEMGFWSHIVTRGFDISDLYYEKILENKELLKRNFVVVSPIDINIFVDEVFVKEGEGSEKELKSCLATLEIKTLDKLLSLN